MVGTTFGMIGSDLLGIGQAVVTTVTDLIGLGMHAGTPGTGNTPSQYPLG
ncbi:hypothetical protein [Nocardia stercoris]|nr:hypothetical protein [Nocardia stercoris]